VFKNVGRPAGATVGLLDNFKTLLPALACFIIGAPLLLVRDLGIDRTLLSIGAAAALTELPPVPVDGNFTIPIGSGPAMIAARAFLVPPLS
jgi:hypothetical protein